jgi:hypothetical protein
MAVTTLRRTTEPRSDRQRLALAVADVNWFTTENLFRELDRLDVSSLLLKCLDYVNAFRRGLPPWAWGGDLRHPRPGLWQKDLVLPTGWMKRYPTWGMRPIGRSILDWRRTQAAQGPLALIMTYPHYLYLRDQVRPDIQVYFNVDDYSQYWPRFADRVNELERQAVREADLTVCVSRLRCDQLRASVPEAAGKIRHLPHGTPTSTLGEFPQERPAPPPEDLAGLPRPLLGYVGSLEDRVDWALLSRVADAFPQASIVLIGKLRRRRPEPWFAECRRCLSRPNVHYLGWRPQEAIGRYNRSFDICLIPYRTDHPFNVVCSPTKIMDYMGTGRPIVSTALPECRLYSDLFDVAPDTSDFLASIELILRRGSDDGRAGERFAWAKANTCRSTVERLLGWLPV